MIAGDDVAIGRLAEEYRRHLPEGFQSEVDEVEAALLKGRLVDAIQAKGGKEERNRNISRCVLSELRELLCGKGLRYGGVRKGGRALELGLAVAMGKTVGEALSVDEESATACVLFLWQVCRRVGAKRFCELWAGEGK